MWFMHGKIYIYIVNIWLMKNVEYMVLNKGFKE